MFGLALDFGPPAGQGLLQVVHCLHYLDRILPARRPHLDTEVLDFVAQIHLGADMAAAAAHNRVVQRILVVVLGDTVDIAAVPGRKVVERILVEVRSLAALAVAADNLAGVAHNYRVPVASLAQVGEEHAQRVVAPEKHYRHFQGVHR